MRERLYMVIFTVIMASFAAAILTFANTQLKKYIDQNKKLEVYENVLKVFDIPFSSEADFDEIERIYNAHISVEKRNGIDVYTGYETEAKTEDELLGYAFKITGPGFWGKITGFLALKPGLETIRGITFFEHEETPGLGGRIDEKDFQQQFIGKKIYPEGSNEPLIVISPPGTDPFGDSVRNKPQNEVDAITGASETSRAVERFMNKCIKDFISVMKK